MSTDSPPAQSITPPPQGTSPLRVHWPLILILALAAVLRLYALDRSPLWTDELFSLQSTAGLGFQVENLPRMQLLDPAPKPTELRNPGPLRDIYTTQFTDTHPPLYFMVLRVWREWTGDSATALRLPSVAASLVVVAALYAAMAISVSRRAAVLAGLLAALAGSQIIFAQEVRGYALAAAFTTTAAAALLRIEQVGWSVRRGVWLGGSAVLAVCTLYLAAVPLVAMGVYSVCHLRGATRIRTVLTGVVAAGVGLAILTPLLLQQRLHLGERNAWLTSEEPRTPVAVLADASAAVYSQLAPLQDQSRPAAYLAGIVLVIMAIPLYRKHPPARIWLIWLALSVGVLGAWDLLANKTHLQLPRYTLIAAPAVVGLIASLATVGASAAGKSIRLIRLLPFAALLLCLVSLPEAYRVTKEDWFLLRNYAQTGHARPTDLYVVAGHSPRRWEHILYLGLSRYLPDVPFAVVISSRPEDDLSAFRNEAERRGGIVLFTEFDSNATAAIPPGWTRTGLTNVPSLGTLQTFRPAGGTAIQIRVDPPDQPAAAPPLPPK